MYTLKGTNHWQFTEEFSTKLKIRISDRGTRTTPGNISTPDVLVKPLSVPRIGFMKWQSSCHTFIIVGSIINWIGSGGRDAAFSIFLFFFSDSFICYNNYVCVVVGKFGLKIARLDHLLFQWIKLFRIRYLVPVGIFLCLIVLYHIAGFERIFYA